MANSLETMETVTDFIYFVPKTTQMVTAAMNLKKKNKKTKNNLLLGQKAMTNLDSILKKQRHYFANKDPSNQGYTISSSHVRM